MDNSDNALDFDTLAVRAGTLRSDFNEHSEAIFLTSSFLLRERRRSRRPLRAL